MVTAAEQGQSQKGTGRSTNLRWLPPVSEASPPEPSVLGAQGDGAHRNNGLEAVPDSASAVAPVVLMAPGGGVEDVLADPFGDREIPQEGGKPKDRNAPKDGGGEPPRNLRLPAEVLPAPPPIVPPQPLGADLGRRDPTVAVTASQPTPRELTPSGKPPQELLETIPQGPTDERPLEQQLAQVPGVGKDECPPLERMRKITEITHNIAPKPGKFPVECPLEGGEFGERRWAPTTFTWTASALCHKPLYFEQVGVERYGHNLGPLLQPFASGAHFFLTIPILPYKVGLTPPDECIYALGYYRPGSCAPRILDPFPLSVRAALAEGGAWTALAFLVP